MPTRDADLVIQTDTDMQKGQAAVLGAVLESVQ